MRDETDLRRHWLLLKSLSSRHQGLTVHVMAADAGVMEKTIHRDLDHFRRVGFPLEECAGEFGRKTCRIKATGNQPPLSYCVDEAIALYLGRRLLEPLSRTVFWEAVQRAFEKIRASLGQSPLNYLDRQAFMMQDRRP